MFKNHYYLLHFSVGFKENFLYQKIENSPNSTISDEKAIHYVKTPVGGLKRTAENKITSLTQTPNGNLIARFENDPHSIQTDINDRLNSALSNYNKEIAIINNLIKVTKNLSAYTLETAPKVYKKLYNSLSNNYLEDKNDEIVKAVIRAMNFYGDEILKHNYTDLIDNFKIELLSLLTIKTRINNPLFTKFAWNFIDKCNRQTIKNGDIKTGISVIVELIEDSKCGDDIYQHPNCEKNTANLLKEYEQNTLNRIKRINSEFTNSGLNKQKVYIEELEDFLKVFRYTVAEKLKLQTNKNIFNSINIYFSKIIKKIVEVIDYLKKFYATNQVKVAEFINNISQIINTNDSPENWTIFKKICSHIFQEDNFFETEYLVDLFNKYSFLDTKQKIIKLRDDIKSFSDNDLARVYSQLKDVIRLDDCNDEECFINDVSLRIGLQSDFLSKSIDEVCDIV